MAARRGKPRSGRWKRWVLVLAVIALGIGAVAARPLWRRTLSSRQDPSRLDLLYAAFNEFNARHFERASELLDRRAAEITPTALDWMLRARIAESQGRLADGLAHLKRIPDADPIGAQAWLKVGQIELKRHHARAAEAAYRRSLALDADQVQPRRELAYLYALQRRKAECDAQFRDLAGLVPMDHVLAFAWCQNYCGIWDPRGPRPVLTEFLAEDPDDRWSRLALAASYQLTSEFDQAEASLRALPDSDPDARALRVQLAIDRGEIPLAETLARGGPADHVRLNALRGRLALFRNDARQAAVHFRAALRQDPGDRDSNHGLGQALRRQGDPEAGTYLEIASRQDQLMRMIQASVTTIKTDPKLFDKLGSLCVSLGLDREARVWYQIAISRDAFDTEAQQALTRLDQTSPTRPAAPPAARN
jgi:tetratricopeptide (TPR) repeat protein